MVIHRYRHLEVSKWKSCSALGFSQASSPVIKPYPRTQIFQWPLSYGVSWWMLSTQESKTKRNSSRKNFDGKIDTSWRRILQFSSVQFRNSVMSDSANPWTAAIQASLSITNSHSPPKPMSIELVMPSSHLILYCPLLLLPSIFPSIRVFSNESVLRIRWPKYWSFSFINSPSNEHPGLISFRMDWLDLLAVQGTLKSLFQHHSSKASILQRSAFFTVQLSHPYMTTGKTIALILKKQETNQYP